MTEITTKANWPDKNFLPGFQTETVEGEAMVDLTDAGLSTIETAMDDGTKVVVEVDINTGTRTFDGYVKSFKYNGPRNEALTASYSIQGTSAVVSA